MLVDSSGDVIITSDGRTILDKMDIEHPAAKMMVEVAKTQDAEVGDGTTTSVILAGELLGKAEDLLNKGVHPTVIVEGYSKAADKALETLENIAIPVDPAGKEFLKKVAATSMASKLVAENKEQLAGIAVEAVLNVARKVGEGYVVDLDDIMVEKKPGESMSETRLIEGFIEKHQGAYSVRQQCQALGVSRSGYYAWRVRQPRKEDPRLRALLEHIQRIYQKKPGHLW